MNNLTRFGISMDNKLLSDFDQRIEQAGYQNRSEAIRDLVRAYLIGSQWEEPEATVIGTITLVYDHHSADVEHQLTHQQHQHLAQIYASTHVHVDEDNCLEVIIVRGTAAAVRSLAEHLIAQRGVKHGELVRTTTGAGLT